jgi:hypothetical protein
MTRQLGKACTKCGQWKLLMEYHTNNLNRDGKTSICKQCSRRYHTQNNHKAESYFSHVFRTYGISSSEWWQIYDYQSGCCALCGTPFDELKVNQIHMDHSEEAGVVRGLLCSTCNHDMHLVDTVTLDKIANYKDRDIIGLLHRRKMRTN